jgi:ribose transport system permease protein
VNHAADPTLDAAPPPAAARAESLRETLTRWRYRWWPDHWLGEILSKRWTETAIPVLLLVIVLFASGRLIGNFWTAGALADTLRQAGEIGFVVLGLGLVMIVGGIDLSVSSMFALTNFAALMMVHVLKWRCWARWPAARCSVRSTACWSACCGCVPSSPRSSR